ncbi:hypothetical protein [Streptomyces qinglanensis]|uniref:Uncharacterized protein n=1 Tax=Streptomyces qinglanensis TaxID=943816 RepID=A0A1H9SSW5_9ACTN|nr:hypothetical protein [Streptomyces qinglanensis]SER88046.1 hypothetical protein SAMN05421870_10570 [Streptomyces qinglanensis]
MSVHDEDSEKVFLRSKWGTGRYVYNPYNPVGRMLIVLSLVIGGVVLYGYSRSGFLGPSASWEAEDLRLAVIDASEELSGASQFGPASGGGMYPEILRSHIAENGPVPAQESLYEEALVVELASDPPRDGMLKGGAEIAAYNVTASGTDAAFCLNVHAERQRRHVHYDTVSIDMDEHACPGAEAPTP